MKDASPRELGVSAVARTLKMTMDSVYRMIWAGRIEARKAEDGKWVIRESIVEARLQKRKARLRQMAG